MRTASFVSLAILLVAASGAGADVDLGVRNGDRVAGTLAPGATDVFRVLVPYNASLLVKARAVRGLPVLRVRILDAASNVILNSRELPADRTGKSVAVKTFPRDVSDELRVEVTSQDAAKTGDYTLSVSWKTPTNVASSTTSVAPGGATGYTFGADAGSTVTYSVKPSPKKSPADPYIQKIDRPDGSVTFIDEVSGVSDLAQFGTYLLWVTAATTPGQGFVTIRVKPPKAAKRKLTLTRRAAPSGNELVAAGVVGPAGGIVETPAGGPIDGAAISIPPGALAKPVSVLIGTGTAVVPAVQGFVAGGPAVFLGPEGLTFRKSNAATVTIPYDPASFPADTSGLRVFTRGADGTVTEIAGVTIDSVNHVVVLNASHFSVFQVFRALATATQAAGLFRADGSSFDRFGASVALDATTLVVGSPDFDLPGAADTGQVFAYANASGLATPEILEPTGLSAGDGFGQSVAIQGTTLVCGAPGRDSVNADDCGTVRIYEFVSNQWQLHDEISADDGAPGDLFGSSIAIDGTTMVIGAPGVGDRGIDAGAVYVFVFNGSNWTKQDKLFGDATSAFDRFGNAVAISGGTILAGAHLDDVAFPGGGAGYVFVRNLDAWPQEARLEAVSPGNNLGTAVAIQGDTAVCAQPGVAQGVGNVIVFTRAAGVWSIAQALQGDGGPEFGRSVSFSGDRVIVGQPSGGTGAGAFVFKRDATTFVLESIVSGASFGAGADSAFGGAVAISGARFVVGAPNDDPTGTGGGTLADGGKAFVFDLP